MKTSTFAKAVDPNDLAAVEGLGGTAPAAAPAAVEHPFYAEYAKTGEDTIFSAYYYDCTILVALAAQAAGSDDPAEIRDHMLDVASGGTACQSFAACKELLDQGEDIDYEGASGPVDLDENHEPTYGVYDVWAYNTAGEATNKEGVAQIRIED
jgi:branched-chain amino acid transport system substrate-binding protein